jgi:hypothetical protein
MIYVIRRFCMGMFILMAKVVLKDERLRRKKDD